MDVYKYVNKSNTTITVGAITIAPYGEYISNTTVAELDKIDGTLLDKYFNQQARQDPAEFNYYRPVISNTKGDGIQLDITSPTFGWHDLLSPTIIYEGASSNKPNFNVLVGGIRKYQFLVNDESFHEFHIPHDYLPGSDLYIHVHWTHNSGASPTGSTTWQFESTYAKGYSQQAFSSTKLLTVNQSIVSTALTHHIAEVKFSTSGGTASTLNSLDIETDGLILTRTSLISNTTGVNPFMLFCDVHYQTTGIATKNRNYNFWT